MTTSTKRNLRIGLAAAVLAAAAWAAAAQAQQNPAPQERPRTDTRSLRRELARDLFNITPEQEKKVQELREAGRKDRQAYRGEMLKLRGEMRGLMKDPEANAAKIDKLIDSRARLRAEQEKRGFRSREELRKAFSPEQLEKMKKYSGLVRERFGAGFGARPGRPGMARPQGRGAARGQGMGPGARRWRHPDAGWIW